VNTKILLAVSAATVLFFSGCAPKTYVSTSPIMSYDLTGVDITTLKSSKVCFDGENTDVSVRHAAEIAGIKTVYAVDDHTIYETHLFSGPTVKSSCTIIYGVADTPENIEATKNVNSADVNETVVETVITDNNTSKSEATVVEDNNATAPEDNNTTSIEQ